MNANRNLIHWANLLYLLIMGASLLVTGNPAKGSSGRPPWMDPAVGMVVAQIGLILIPSLLFVWLTRQPFNAIFKLKRLSFGSGIKCFLIGLPCWAVFIFLSSLTQALLMLFSPARAGSPTDIATAGGHHGSSSWGWRWSRHCAKRRSIAGFCSVPMKNA
jgi:hypothetical protein